MARIELITDRAQAATPEQRTVFDAVVGSRGKMIRPFEVLLHAPSIAEPLSEVGARIRFAGTLSDHDRELVILTTATVHGCRFEWDSHLPIATEAGVRAEALDHLRGRDAVLTEHEELIISYVRRLCSDSTVPEDLFARAEAALGATGVVEMTAAVGYYTLLAYVMGAADAC